MLYMHGAVCLFVIVLSNSFHFCKRLISISSDELKSFFCRFFKMYPDAVKMFDRVNGQNIYSPKFKAHMLRIAAGKDAIEG